LTEDFDPFAELLKPEAATGLAEPKAEDPVLTEALKHLEISLNTIVDVIRSLDRWQRYDLELALAYFKRHSGFRRWPGPIL